MRLMSQTSSSGFGVVLEPVSAHTLQVISWLFTSLSAVFLICRLFIRIHTFRRLDWDDVLVIIAWIQLLSSSIITYTEDSFVQWFYDVSTGKSNPTEAFALADLAFTHDFLALIILFYCCLWSIKYSFLIFFRRLLSKQRSHRIWWWVVCAFTTAGLIASIADIQYECIVGSPERILTQCDNRSTNDFRTNVIYSNMATDIFSDILILSIPIILLWNVRISRRQKMILYGLFSATIVIMTIAIIRAALIRPDPNLDQTVSTTWIVLWGLIEMGVAIMIACVASLRQYFVGNTDQKVLSSNSSGTWPSIRSLLQLRRRTKQSSDVKSVSHEQCRKADISPNLPKLEFHDTEHDIQHHMQEAGSIYVCSTIDIASEPMPVQPQPAQRFQHHWGSVDHV